MNSTPDVSHSIVSERLKFVDILVKGGRINDALKEIAGIKEIEPTNPYAQAYEERLLTMMTSVREREGRQESLQEVANPSTTTIRQTKQESSGGSTKQIEDLLRSSKQQAEVLDSSDGREVPSNANSKGRASIVLVDDDELLLMALAELLEDNKYTTKTFTKSEDALEYIKGHKPDLLLCDVNLRNSTFGGFTLFEKMAKLGHLQNVPFVFMSGLADDAIIRAGKELGADDYLTKPIEPDMLLAVVKGKLRKYKLKEKNL